MGLSLDAWNSIVLLSLGVAALAAVAVVVSQGIAFRLQKQEATAARAELEQYKASAAQEIASANKAAAQANEEAARANERAQSARLETESIKQQLAWRELTPGQATTLRAELSKSQGSVTLIYVMGDPESLRLMQQFEIVFRQAQWNVGIQSRMPADQNSSGILLVESGTAEAISVSDAFGVAAIPFVTGQLPAAQQWQGAGLGPATILVGSKPIPTP